MGINEQRSDFTDAQREYAENPNPDTYARYHAAFCGNRADSKNDDLTRQLAGKRHRISSDTPDPEADGKLLRSMLEYALPTLTDASPAKQAQVAARIMADMEGGAL